jgi:hypothetical protein
VIESALDSWSRTFRLCLILLVTIAAPVAAAAVAELIRHMLLCECRVRRSVTLRLFQVKQARQYQAARHRSAGERGGWLSLDDPDEYDFMACRWPVLSNDFVRGPPGEVRESA